MTPPAPVEGPSLETPEQVRGAIAALGGEARARAAARFFKTGPGQYSEGDRFLGVGVPELRAVARRSRGLTPRGVLDLLQGGAHEERMAALLVWQAQFEAGDEGAREGIVKAYLASTRWVNNWDLVDASAAPLLGAWLLTRDRSVLRRLAVSPSLWERRIAIVATHRFVRHGESKDALELSAALLDDAEDLMHKAVGWTLREVGKRVSPDVLRAFLEEHAARMPRAALRNAVERFVGEERHRWMGPRPRRPRGGARGGPEAPAV